MYVTLTVTKWQDNKYSGGRVSPADHGLRQFIINPSYMYDIRVQGTGSKFYLTDRSLDRRESSAYLEVNESIATIRTAHDTPMSNMITLPVYHNNNPAKGTYQVTIPSEYLIYADRDNADPLGASWVMTQENAFKLRRGLARVALSIEDILTASSLLKDYDGNGYTTTIIGAQEWIVENYRVTHYADGTAIPNITNGTLWQADTTGAYCYYDNDPANFDFIGLLYNWYALGNVHVFPYLERGGVQEIGWRVPTVADWDVLTAFCGGPLVAGGVLKETGIVHWDNPNIGALDTYGFKWISGGNRFIDDPANPGFSMQGVYGDVWTADAFDADEAHSEYASNGSVSVTPFVVFMYAGLNVRLVRDV